MKIVPSIVVSRVARGLLWSRARLCVALILFAVLIAPTHSTFALYPHGTNGQAYVRSQVSHAQKLQPTSVITIVATAYSSTEDQTDDTPCIAAQGFDLCAHNTENVIATNMLPLGTKVRFTNYNPDIIYTVVDRMHERYNARIDFWKTSRDRAGQFGIRTLKMEIYE